MADDPHGLRMQLDVINQQERHLKAELKQARAMQDGEQVQSIEQRLQANERTFFGIKKALKRMRMDGL